MIAGEALEPYNYEFRFAVGLADTKLGGYPSDFDRIGQIGLYIHKHTYSAETGIYSGYESPLETEECTDEYLRKIAPGAEYFA